MPRRSNVDLGQVPNRPTQNQDALPTRFDFLDDILADRGGPGRDGPLGGRFAELFGDRGGRGERFDGFPRCPQEIKVDDLNANQGNHDWFFGG